MTCEPPIAGEQCIKQMHTHHSVRFYGHTGVKSLAACYRSLLIELNSKMAGQTLPVRKLTRSAHLAMIGVSAAHLGMLVPTCLASLQQFIQIFLEYRRSL